MGLGGSEADAVERCRELVDGIVWEMQQTLLAHSLVAEEDEAVDTSPESALRDAVQKRIGDFDAAVMSALDSYAEVLASQPDDEMREMAHLLLWVRDVVVDIANDELPEEVRLVDVLARLPTDEGRDEVLALAKRGGGTGPGGVRVPSCPPERVVMASTNIVDDIEKRESLDRRAWQLLARVCAAREAARRHADDASAGSPFGYHANASTSPSNLLAGDVALLQGLYAVADPQRRRALIRDAFDEAFERPDDVALTQKQEFEGRERAGGPINLGRTAAAGGGWSAKKKPRAAGGVADDAVPASELTDELARRCTLRPGRWLDMLANMQQGMAAEHAAKVQAGSLTGADARPPVQLEMLSEIRADTLATLAEMAD